MPCLCVEGGVVFNDSDPLHGGGAVGMIMSLSGFPVNVEPCLHFTARKVNRIVLLLVVWITYTRSCFRCSVYRALVSVL